MLRFILGLALAFTLALGARADDNYNCHSNARGASDFTMSCIYVPPLISSAILPAPTTNFQNGNYATGCSASPGAASSVATNHTCLNWDDHWDGTGTSSGANLSLANWAPGIFMCNNGGTNVQNCGWFPGGTPAVNYPLSSWCQSFGGNGCFDSAIYAYPYAAVPPVSGIDTTSLKPLAKTPEGWLALATINYFPQTANNGTSGFCSGSTCQYLNYIGGGMTTGGAALSPPTNYPNSVNNRNAIIPVTGGMLQWRMKLDDGVLAGGYFSTQCSAVGGSYPAAGANDANANFEFGYLYNGAADARALGLGVNDTPNSAGGVTLVSSGDDGVGTGDTRNWHTYALEWTGNTNAAGSKQWWYYVDGVAKPVITHAETRVPTIGWGCTFTHNIASAGQVSFHSMWDTGWSQGGAFYAYLSDVQIYKKPGT